MLGKRVCAIFVCCFLILALLTACGKPGPADIMGSIKTDKSVQEYAVSHNGKTAAVIRFIKKDDTTAGQLDIVDISGNQQKTVAGISNDDLHTITWSHDDSYLSVDAGTAAQHTVYVIKTTAAKKVLTLGATSKVIWSDQADFFAVSAANKKIKQVEFTELDGTPEVRVYDMNTLNSKVVMEADSQYECNPVKWDKSGLSVERFNMTTQEKSTELLKL